MEINYDNLLNWFDGYFKAFNKYAGVPETIPNMEKYFTDDLQFKHYMGSSGAPSTRADLLLSMLHPGVHEELTPLDYAVDLKKMVVVVRLQLQFTEEPTNTVYPPKHACAYYYLTLDKNKDPIIKSIHYFTEHTPPGRPVMAELMKRYQEKFIASQK